MKKQVYKVGGCKHCKKGAKPFGGYHSVVDIQAGSSKSAFMAYVKCTNSSPLKPKKSIKKMEKKKLDWVDIECTCGCKTSWRIIGVKQTVRVVMSQIL